LAATFAAATGADFGAFALPALATGFAAAFAGALVAIPFAFVAGLLADRGDAFVLVNGVLLLRAVRVGTLFRRFAAWADFIGVAPPRGRVLPSFRESGTKGVQE
jgi:hypothetical protein